MSEPEKLTPAQEAKKAECIRRAAEKLARIPWPVEKAS